MDNTTVLRREGPGSKRKQSSQQIQCIRAVANPVHKCKHKGLRSSWAHGFITAARKALHLRPCNPNPYPRLRKSTHKPVNQLTSARFRPLP